MGLFGQDETDKQKHETGQSSGVSELVELLRSSKPAADMSDDGTLKHAVIHEALHKPEEVKTDEAAQEAVIDQEEQAKVEQELGEDAKGKIEQGKVYAKSRFLDMAVVRIFLMVLVIMELVFVGILVYTGYFNGGGKNSEPSVSVPSVIDQKVSEIIGANPDMKVIEVDESVIDDELGYTVRIGRVLYDVPVDIGYVGASDQYVGVAIELELDNHTNISDSVLELRNLSLASGGMKMMDRNAMFSEFIGANEASVVTDAGSGQKISGLLFFYVPRSEGEGVEMVFSYDRPEIVIGVIGGTEEDQEKVIEAKEFTVAFRLD